MHDIRLTRESAHALVCLSGEVEGLGDEVYLLAVSRIQVAGYQLVVGLADEFLVSGFAEFKVIVVHRKGFMGLMRLIGFMGSIRPYFTRSRWPMRILLLRRPLRLLILATVVRFLRAMALRESPRFTV